MATQLSLTLILTLSFLLISTTSSIPARELDTMLDALRAQRGYSLIANAVTTSDLKLALLNIPSFTLFAPTDSSVFALDVSAETTAFYYVAVLRSHFIPNRRLSAADIRRLQSSSPSTFPSMLPSRNVTVVRDSASSELVSVDGVDMVLPGLFYARHVAVHGLAGILPGTPPPLSPRPRQSPSRQRRRGRRGRNGTGRGRGLPKVSQVNSTVVISPPETVTSWSNRTVLSPPVPDNGSSLAPGAVNGSVFAPSPWPRNDGLVNNSSGFSSPPRGMERAPVSISLPPTSMENMGAPVSASLPPTRMEMSMAPVSVSLPPTRTEMMGAPAVSKVALVEGRNLVKKCDLDSIAVQCYPSLEL